MKRKRQGTTFHICHWCKHPNGFRGNVNARFCSSGCRSASWKHKVKSLVNLLESFFNRIGFSLSDLLDFCERALSRVIRVANLLGYEYNEIAREWEHGRK